MNKTTRALSLAMSLIAVVFTHAAHAAEKTDAIKSAKAKVSASSQLSAKPRAQKPGLLLPAVQAGGMAPSEPVKSRRMTTGQPDNSQGADTSCSGVNACNDMIATCLALGGNVTATEYEPNTGAPSGATCFSPGS